VKNVQINVDGTVTYWSNGRQAWVSRARTVPDIELRCWSGADRAAWAAVLVARSAGATDFEAVSIERRMGWEADADALDRIAALLRAVEHDADALDTVREIVAATGRNVQAVEL
jgi:hypothetical protein